MEYLQYLNEGSAEGYVLSSFKPYYKWNTFNTIKIKQKTSMVLLSFKPYYKWNTFNTVSL